MNVFEDTEKYKKTILHFFHIGYLCDPARTEKTILQMPWRSKDFCVSSHSPPAAASCLWSSLASKNFRSNVLSMNASSIKCWRLDHRTKNGANTAFGKEKGITVSLLGFLSQQFRCSCKFTLALLITTHYSILFPNFGMMNYKKNQPPIQLNPAELSTL
jgi:hypothetical protein